MVEARLARRVPVSGGLLVVSGVLFLLMVKAMARIQMPERLPPQ